MARSKSNFAKAGMGCFVVNGLIFIFYAISVPSFVTRVHWLITLAAILFLVALPMIRLSLKKAGKHAADAVIISFGAGMFVIVISDLAFALSIVGGFAHDVTYAFGNALFILSLIGIGVLALKTKLPKWVGALSIIVGLIGLLTYAPVPPLVPTLSLFLIGVWSLAMGFVFRKAK